MKLTKHITPLLLMLCAIATASEVASPTSVNLPKASEQENEWRLARIVSDVPLNIYYRKDPFPPSPDSLVYTIKWERQDEESTNRFIAATLTYSLSGKQRTCSIFLHRGQKQQTRGLVVDKEFNPETDFKLTAKEQ